jgi:outer membrane protein assembly factor BamB
MDAGANQPLTAIFAPHDKNNYTVNSINVYINVLIADSDSDGLTDGDEVNIHKTNPLIADTDSDGLTDGDEVNKYGTKPLIADTDQDGLTDGDEVNIHKTNPNLPDTDSDGLNDGDEVNKYGTDPLDADSDDDSFTDGEEVAAGTDPNDKNSNPAQDSDNDSLTDIAEVQVHKTNPNLPDTDSDGLNDGDEVNKYKTNPLVVDTDKDKFTDAEEVAAGTDPNDPDDFPINVVAPVITVPPDSVFAQSGVDVSFSVEALGEPIAYQWYKNGKPIAGADGSMLSLLNITNEAEANYRIEVSNEAGKDAREAQLTVVETAPVISDIPTRFDTVYELGETARLAPKIESEGPTTYQWRKDGNDLEGETGPTLIIEDVKDADVGDYTVAATNLVGETVSETMQVSVFDEAKIGTHVENKFNLASGAIHSSPAVGQDGTIYYSTIGQSPQLYASQPNGVNQWIEPFDSPLRGSPAIDGNGIIYVLEDAGVLHAVSPIDGKKLWQYKLTGEYADASGEPEYYRNSPAITEDNTVIFGWFDGTVYAVKDENLVWEFPTEDPFYASPSIGPDGTVYIGSSAGDLYAINSADGKPVWSKPFSTGDAIITRPAIDTDGHIYFGSNSGKFYALYPNRGEKWHFPTEQEIWSSAVIRGDGTVYFGGDDGKFYALYTETGVDPKTEKPKWVYKIDTNYQMSASAALGLDGSIYFTLFDNTFYAIKRTGEKDWSVRLKPEDSDSASYSSPALLDDGKIYVGAQDGKDQGQLNVIQGGSPIDNESPWPSFGGDLQNTGRVMVKKTDADSFKAKLRVIEASGENVKIQITGDAFETYKLQHSNDLKVWKAVPNLEPIKTNFRGKADFSRTPTPDSGPVFYRLMNE